MMSDQSRTNNSIYLRKIQIRNFKAIDELALEFPTPTMPDEPDIFVMGSKNGVGKTSVLEAIALLFMIASFHPHHLASFLRYFKSHHLQEQFIRSGCRQSTLVGEFEVNGVIRSLELALSRTDEPQVSGVYFGEISAFTPVNFTISNDGFFEAMVSKIFGRQYESFVYPHFLHFHSFRKVLEGSVDMGQLLNDKPTGARPAISGFKMEVLRALMGQRGLFEEFGEAENAEHTLEKLNGLMQEFANGTIEKLRATAGNALEIRVKLKDGHESISFDSLSSGQKEIISTFFTIWLSTKDRPGIVLIDEPELHLHPVWIRKFIRQLTRLAPRNQYIIATHSYDIFDTVDQSRRMLLVDEEE